MSILWRIEIILAEHIALLFQAIPNVLSKQKIIALL